MDKEHQAPDATKFGTADSDLTALGAAFLDWLRASFAWAHQVPSWKDLPAKKRHSAKANWLTPKYGEGHEVFWAEAVRCAAEGKLLLAGKHYRSWFNISLIRDMGADVDSWPSVRRQWASVRATAAKKLSATERASAILKAAIEILEKRVRPISDNELARLTSRQTGIPKETCRRILKQRKHPLDD